MFDDEVADLDQAVADAVVAHPVFLSAEPTD
jgi:hypothetical protein